MGGNRRTRRGRVPRPLRTWAPVVLLVIVALGSFTVVALGLRPSPPAPVRAVNVASGTWAPFVGPDLPDGGPVAELVTEVLNRAGYAPQITYTSWALADEQAAGGAVLGAFPLVGSESRRANLLLSDSLLDFEYVLFYNAAAGQPQVDDAQDLAGLRVGAIAGYDYWTELDDAVTSYVEFDSSLEGFEALAAGEIDLLAEGLVTGQAVLADPAFAGDAADFSYLQDDDPLVRSVQGLYFMMADTAESAEVMSAFNAALAQLRQEPEYAELIAGLGAGTPATAVTLVPSTASGHIELLDEDGAVVLLAPAGTTARVLAWPEEFVGGGVSDPAAPVLVEVKITNGPAQGRVVYVDSRSLLLEGS